MMLSVVQTTSTADMNGVDDAVLSPRQPKQWPLVSHPLTTTTVLATPTHPPLDSLSILFWLYFLLEKEKGITTAQAVSHFYNITRDCIVVTLGSRLYNIEMFVALTHFLFQKGSTVSAAAEGGFLLLFCPSHSRKTGSPYIFSLSTAIKTGDAFSFSIIRKLSPTDDAALPPTQSYMCDDDVQQEAYIIREIYIYNI